MVRHAAGPRRGVGGGWRALGWFWGLTALLALGVGGSLAWLGPPPLPSHPSGPTMEGAPAAASQWQSAAAEAQTGEPVARAGVDAFAPVASDGATAATGSAIVRGSGASALAGDAAAARMEGGATDGQGVVTTATSLAGTGGIVAAAGLALPPPAPEPPPLAAASVSSAVLVTPPPAPGARPIAPPDPALLEERGDGVRLPRIGPGGRTSFRAYAHAGFDRADTRPRVAVVLAGIGRSAGNAEEVIRRLPPAVTLALNPYAPRLDQLAERARERGMETLVAVPTESSGYPVADPAGDRALLTGASLAENFRRLDWALARTAGYVGVLGGLGPLRGGGERSALLSELMGSVQDVLCSRGLLFVDPRPGAPDPSRAWGRAVDIVLDEPATRGEIERRLADLERLARERGSAVGLAGEPAPVLVERLAVWAAGLDARGVALAPVTAVIRRPANARCEGDVPSGGSGIAPVPASSVPPRH